MDKSLINSPHSCKDPETPHLFSLPFRPLTTSLPCISLFSALFPFSDPSPASPPCDSPFSSLLAEWSESCSAQCHDIMETGSHGCLLTVPESFFILSLVTPENNYFKDPSQCLVFQFISLPSFSLSLSL